jgi:hypothetical protein
VAITGVSGAATVGGLATVAGAAGFGVGYGIGSIRIGGTTIHEHLGNAMYYVGSGIQKAASNAWNFNASR